MFNKHNLANLEFIIKMFNDFQKKRKNLILSVGIKSEVVELISEVLIDLFKLFGNVKHLCAEWYALSTS